ncbi:hypothetical protein [uncultured Prevotella sp.]|uniref:hypothetical protein n=1 Tax=uncultured Prevotella sp. TaxID=159272 RepID=UPI00262DA526|nr:hypothetical protein [uncultured Prevotella sp.]
MGLKLLSFLNDLTKLQTYYTYTHNKSVREKICHIFQFPHNTLCINDIKAGRQLRNQVIYQPICQPQQPIFQPAVARAPRAKLKNTATKEHEATCKPV